MCNRLIVARLQRLVLAAAFALMLLAGCLAIAVFIRENWRALRFPYALDYGEGVVLDQTMRMARFADIYLNSFATPPLIVSNYPPLYAFAQVPFAWAFGPALWYGRLISILSATAAALLLGLTVSTITQQRRAGIVSGMMLLAFPCIIYWSGLNRIDALALALSLGGMYSTVRCGYRHRGIACAAILFTLSVYTRQSYILAAPAASVVWLAAQQQRRQAVSVAAATATLCASVFLFLNTLSGGGFWLNIISANVGMFDWGVLRGQFQQFLGYSPILALYSVGIVASAAIRNDASRRRAWWLAGPYLAGALVSALTVGKEGSNINYLFELAAALSLCAGIALAWLSNRRWLQPLFMLGIAAQFIIMVHGHATFYARDPNALADTEKIERLSQIIRTVPDPVLSDITVDLLVLNGHSLYYEPFARRQLTDAGLWNPAAFIADIRARKFSLILLAREDRSIRWTPQMLDAIYASYRLDRTIAGTDIYRPNP